MSPQKIIHQESYLYPSQLSMISAQSSNVQKFLFNSPINSYSTVFDISSKQCDFIDHEGEKCSKMHALQISEDEKCTVMHKSDTIKFITSTDDQIGPIRVDSQKEILSDIVNLKSLSHGIKNVFNLAYLTEKRQGSQSLLHLNIKGFNKQNSVMEDEKFKLNPEADQYFETSQEQQFYQKSSPIQQKFSEMSYIELEIPFYNQSRPKVQPNFQILPNVNPSAETLMLFEKKSSMAYIYDLEYEAFSNIISCRYDQENQIMTDFQGNQISLLSQNLIVNSHSNGVIKLIDKRVGRVTHVRNLLEEITQFGERPSIQKQGNYIKFWNASKTQTIDNPIDPKFQFLINLKNKIYQVDLRNNRLVKEDSVFEFNSNEQLSNYEIVQNHNESLVAFTTEGHSSFKAYVVNESKGK